MRNVLFVCSDNAVLGPMAEACLNSAGGGHLRAFSAAPVPAGCLNPAVERLLRHRGHPVDLLTPKSWDVFALPFAPAPDLLIALGDVPPGAFAPGSEPRWQVAPQRRYWRLDTGESESPSARLAELYEAIRRAVAHILHEALPASCCANAQEKELSHKP